MKLCILDIIKRPLVYFLVHIKLKMRFKYLRDNCIQNFHLGKFSCTATTSGAIKRDNRTPNENSDYGYPHSNALLQFCLKF